MEIYWYLSIYIYRIILWNYFVLKIKAYNEVIGIQFLKHFYT